MSLLSTGHNLVEDEIPDDQEISSSICQDTSDESASEIVQGSHSGPNRNSIQTSTAAQQSSGRASGGLQNLSNTRQSLRRVPRRNPHWQQSLELTSSQSRIQTQQPKGFHLLSLPSEIRNMIYRLACVSDDRIGDDAHSFEAFFKAHNSYSNPNFLLSCRQVHAEVSGIFYSENRFEFSQVVLFNKFLKGLRKGKRALLRQVRLSYHRGAVDRAFRLILTDCDHLTSLEIRLRSAESRIEKGKWNATPILNPLGVVKGQVPAANVQLGATVTVRNGKDEPLSWVATTQDFPKSLSELLGNLAQNPQQLRKGWNPIRPGS